MKCVLCIKESYSKGKKVNIFTFAYGQAGSGDPPPLTISLTVKYPGFFTPSLIHNKSYPGWQSSWNCPPQRYWCSNAGCQKGTRQAQSCRWSQLGRYHLIRIQRKHRKQTFVSSFKADWIICPSAKECIVYQVIWSNCDWAVPGDKKYPACCFLTLIWRLWLVGRSAVRPFSLCWQTLSWASRSAKNLPEYITIYVFLPGIFQLLTVYFVL